MRAKTLLGWGLIPFAFNFLFPSLAGAQTTVYSTALLPYPLQDLGHSPRAVAMGSAFAAAEGDASCLYWNPAGLDGLAAPEIALVHESWIAGIDDETLLGAFPIAGAGAMGLGASYLNFGTLQGYDSEGNPSSSYSPSRLSFTAGWGWTLAHSISVGFSATALVQNLTPGSTTEASSVSAGVLWRVLPTLRVGAFYSFLYSDAPPQYGLIDLGESWALYLFEKKPTLLLFDFSLPPEGVYSIQAGAEQPLFSFLFVRLGYQLELRNNMIGGFQGATGGLGVELSGFDLDYAFSPQGDLGAAQMVGLTFHFPQGRPPQPVKTPAPAPAPPVAFKPPSEIKPQDQVVQVELHFNLPNSGGSGSVTAASSPEMQQAIAAAAQKVQANPQDAGAWITLGNLYWQAGQPGYTVQSFEEALRLQPGNSQLKAWIDQYKRLHGNNPAP